jgi:thioredoxin-like negative regulator of GroEL
MASINLSQYIAKLETLLEDEAYDEVVFHCRHILQYFPKNVAVYRCLGRALLRESNQDEARDVLTSILRVYPDDTLAHEGLSQISRREGSLDVAIWHLERVYEQNPNNRKIADRLRELYSEHYQVDQARLQLTTGAVARQYARNGLYDQAVEALRKTLEYTPDRVDLRLLLARIQREAGRLVEAAEAALDVLAVLPDCLEANLIMTELWLAERRPSDAQRYLSRIEPLDPYLALQLAQGEPPDEDAFELAEADYQDEARRQLTQTSPDWLEDIGEAEDEGAEDLISDVYFAEEPAAPDPDLDLSEDWLDEGDEFDELAGQNQDTVEAGSAEGKSTGLLAALDDDEDEAAAEMADVPSGEVPAEEPDFASMIEDDDELAAAEDDSLAWLRESGVELVEDEDQAEPQTSATRAEQDGENPFAWLEESGIELSDEEASRFDPRAFEEDVAPLRDPEAVNPLAWLHDSGVEVADDDALEPLGADEAQPADDQPSFDALLADSDIDNELAGGDEDVPDPLDWLADDSLLEEMLAMETLTEGDEEEQSPGEFDLAGVDADELPAADAPTAGPQFESESALFEENDMSNSTDQEFPTWPDDDDDSEELEWLDREPFEDETVPSAGLTPDEEDSIEDEFSGLESLPAEEDSGDTVPVESGGDDRPAEDAEPPDREFVEPGLFGDVDHDFEWQGEPSAGFDDQDEAELENEFASLFEEADEEPFALTGDDKPEQPAAEDEPEWLTSMGAAEEEEAADEPFGLDEEEEEFAASAGDLGGEEEDELTSETPEWLGEMRAEQTGYEEPAAEEPAAEDEPEWLTSMGAAEEEEAADEPFGLDEEEEEFAASAGDLGGEEEDELTLETPEWLGEMRAEQTGYEEPAAEEPAVEEEPEWLSSMGAAEEEEAADEPFGLDEEEEEFAASVGDLGIDEEDELTSETPEWLGEMRAEQTGYEEPAAEEEPDWLTFDEEEEFAASVGDQGIDEEDELTSETPDWLGEIQAEQTGYEESAAEEPAVEEEPEWLTPLEDAVAAEDDAIPAQEEMPDWLRDAQPAPEAAFDDDVEDDFAFDQQEEEADTGTVPDWLAYIGDESEAEEEEETGFDEEALTAASDTPGWLSEVQAASQMGLEDDDDQDHGEPEIPDWLADMEPAEEDDEYQAEYGTEFDAEEEDWIGQIGTPSAVEEPQTEEGPEEEYNWLEEFDTGATEEPTLASRPDFDEAADDEYEREEEPFGQQFYQEEPQASQSVVSWEDYDEDGDEEVASVAADNAPDWLNAMVPGLDVDYEASEDDEPIEKEFAPSARRTQEVRARAQDFGWLVDIVDQEEDQPPETLPGVAPRSGFTFSRPPVWLRQAAGSSLAGAMPAADAEMDAMGDDLPPWLEEDDDPFDNDRS